MRASISVIICTWNRSASLARTLDSLRNHHVVPECAIEVIVIDNNCGDDTPSVVRSMQNGWPLGTLHYVREPRQGKQFALNTAIRHAKGSILAFTDDDVLIPDGWVSEIVEIFKDPEIELVGGRTTLLWTENGPPSWFKPSMVTVLAGVDLGDRILSPPPEGYSPAGTNLVARRSLFDRIGTFSDAHYRHMDYEFGIRARRAGAGVAYRPELIVLAPVDLGIINKRYFRRWYFKLGIASSMWGREEAVQLLGIPRGMWRAVTEDALSVAWASLIGRADETFEREMRLFELLGFIQSVWRRRINPARHRAWVERRSQKRGTTFG